MDLGDCSAHRGRGDGCGTGRGNGVHFAFVVLGFLLEEVHLREALLHLHLFLKVDDGLQNNLFHEATVVGLILVVSLKAILDERDFLFGLADPPLFFQKQSVPIFECVFSASLEVVDYLRPLLVTVVVLDKSQKLDVLGGQPGSLFKSWI